MIFRNGDIPEVEMARLPLLRGLWTLGLGGLGLALLRGRERRNSLSAFLDATS